MHMIQKQSLLLLQFSLTILKLIRFFPMHLIPKEQKNKLLIGKHKEEVLQWLFQQ